MDSISEKKLSDFDPDNTTESTVVASKRDWSDDDTVLKITAAALVHDIGKFAKRDFLGVTDEYILNHAYYQPFRKDRMQHTHSHVIDTVAFIESEKIRNLLPKQFNQGGWGEGGEDCLINLAAFHHNPQTPMQWIIAMADRLSSGWDRREFEDDYNKAVPPQDYQKTRLLSLFEQLERDEEGDGKDTLSYAYPLESLNADSIFPQLKSHLTKEEAKEAKAEYAALFNAFMAELAGLYHRDDNIALWLEHFDSLLLRFTCSIPSARALKVIPDVALYDHLRSTAALAVAQYVYHRDTDTLNDVEAVTDYNLKKFLMVHGCFYGIQDFIFGGHGETRYRAKLLRGRSAMVSLYCELAADFLCRELGMNFASVLFNAAGKFTIIAPNTDRAKDAVKEVEQSINDWLVEQSFGEVAIGFSTVEASGNDFTKVNYSKLERRVNESAAKRKAAKLDLERYGGEREGYLARFSNELRSPLCPICKKRPSSPLVEDDIHIKDLGSSCCLCRDQIFLGGNFVKKTALAITSNDAEIYGDEKLFEPIFGIYQLSFPEGRLGELARGQKLLRHWDIAPLRSKEWKPELTLRFLNGYVPTYSKKDEERDEVISGCHSERKKMELIDGIKEGEIKTLDFISHLSKTRNEEKNEFSGIDALGVLKADVDLLGTLLACGLPPERRSLSRLNTVSRQLHYFFAVYLPAKFKSSEKYENIYTVFAGGDDLFLLGPWNRMIEVALEVQEDFARYTTSNKAVHLSAGFSLFKVQTPVSRMAEFAELALEQAKGNKDNKDKGRDSLTLFGETRNWEDAKYLLRVVKNSLDCWKEKGWINHGFLYRLNTLIEMAIKEEEFKSQCPIDVADLPCCAWRSRLWYDVERNVALQIKGEERRGIVEQVAVEVQGWITKYKGALRMPLWTILYNLRKR